MASFSARSAIAVLIMVALCVLAPAQQPAATAPATTTATRPVRPPVPRSTTQPAQRGPAHAQFMARVARGNIDLVFFGDSITAGWANNAVWKKYYAPRNGANFGIGGERTQHILWGILNGEVDGIAPKVVVLMIGTNNTGENSAAEIAEGITLIVKTLRQKLPASKVLLLGVFPRGNANDPRRAKIAGINKTIAGLDDGKTVRYLDIGPKFLAEDGSLPKEIMPDLLHLSLKGYQIWADAMEPLLTELMGPVPATAPAAPN